MILIVTNSLDATADHLVAAILAAGLRFLRFDTDRSMEGASFRFDGNGPSLRLASRWYRPSDFAVVWYRRPERLHIVPLADPVSERLRAEEWSEFIEGFLGGIDSSRWINHPAANAVASRKIEQLRRAGSLGLRIPETLVTAEAEDLRAFQKRHSGRLIVKPLGSGHLERENGEESLIYTNRLTLGKDEPLGDLAVCPTLFQQEIDKQDDVRITIIDGRTHAVALSVKDSDGKQRCDVRRNNMEDVAYRPIELPHEVASALARLMSSYRLRFGAIDMAVTCTGEWFFFEVNPNGQWAWMDLEGATTIADSFVKAFADCRLPG